MAIQDTINNATKNSGTLAGFTTLPGQTQPEGTTGQITETVEPPMQPPQPTQMPEPSQPMMQEEQREPSPTVVSTDNIREQLKAAETRLKQLKAERDAGEAAPPEDEPEPDTDTTPEETPNPFQAEINEYTKTSNKLIRERKNDFNRYLQRSDSLLRSQVRSIQKTFDERRDQAEQVAANAKAASMVMGSRTGRMRYAPEIQRGIVTGQENALIETLSTLDAQEATLIAEAEGASFDRDYGTFLDKIDSLDGLRKERELKINELQEAMKAENDRRKEEAETAKQETQVIEQISLGVTSPIDIFTELNGSVPFEVIKQMTDTLPDQEAKEFKFITGTKYQQSGYFDPVSGSFTPISRGSGGGVSVGGVSVGPLSPDSTIDDIESLNISDTAKSYVRLWKQGRITQDEILQRIGGDQSDRKLRNEIIGAISQMEPSRAEVNEQISDLNRQKAVDALRVIDNVLGAIDNKRIPLTELQPGDKPGGGGLPTTALGRTIGRFLPGSEARDVFVALDKTLSGMIAFDELKKMREASPTGGALGQVTERELDLLAAQRGSLDFTQSTEQLVETLTTIRNSFARIRAINSPDTTPQQYKQMFPDATQEELNELSARNDIPLNLDDPIVSLQYGAAAAGAINTNETEDPNGYSF